MPADRKESERGFVEIPAKYLPSGVSQAHADLETMRLAAEATNAHAWNHEIAVKAWVLLYLLDQAEIADAVKDSHPPKPVPYPKPPENQRA